MLLGAGSSAAGGGASDVSDCFAAASCAALASAASGISTPDGDAAMTGVVPSSMPSGGLITPAGRLPVQAPAPSPPLGGLIAAGDATAAVSGSPAAAA